MPELPDVTVYVERLAALFVGQPIERIRVASPFLVRSVAPPVSACAGRVLTGVRRVGKRIVWELAGDEPRGQPLRGLREPICIVLHLMIAGRLKLVKSGAAIPGKIGLMAIDFPTATVVLTEAGTKRRASVHLAEGARAWEAFDPGGLEPLEVTREAFAAALTRENHTLKRALTDPHVFSGIGNAYSDEILWCAELSPVVWTSRLSAEQIDAVWRATRDTLTLWTERLRAEAGAGLPAKVTAFRAGMAVHGRYGEACPACGGRVMRIRYADHETNYCPGCQTGGKLLVDRGLSRLLRGDWPKTLDELEARLKSG